MLRSIFPCLMLIQFFTQHFKLYRLKQDRSPRVIYIYILPFRVSMLEMIVNDDGGMEIDVIFTIQLQSPSGSVTAIKATPGNAHILL